MLETIRALILQARGEEWAPRALEEGLSSDDLGGLSWKAGLEALAATRAGDRSAALAAAWEAAHGYYVFGTLSDDFTVVWQVAVSVALAHDDQPLIDRLVALVVDHVGSNPSRGLRAELSRLRALAAAPFR